MRKPYSFFGIRNNLWKNKCCFLEIRRRKYIFKLNYQLGRRRILGNLLNEISIATTIIFVAKCIIISNTSNIVSLW